MDTDLYAEGSIYYYSNSTNTKRDYHDPTLNHDFLVSRPVYVIKQRNVPENDYTINVLTITSSATRVGIPINIDDLTDGKILPGTVYSVHKEYLTKYMGRVNPEIMEEVDKAVRYHLCYSDIKPDYLVKHENEVKEINTALNNLTVKEKSIFDFISNKCIYRKDCYVTLAELFEGYSKKADGEKYTKLQPFSKGIKKMLTFYPSLEFKSINQVPYIYGLSLSWNAHRITDLSRDSLIRKKDINFDLKNPKTSINYEGMKNNELIKLLDEHTLKIYNKMDILEKIGCYHHSFSEEFTEKVNCEFFGIFCALITNDVNAAQLAAFRKLDRGISPYDLNTIEQYAIYICGNEILTKHVARKYKCKGGLRKVKRNIFNNIKHQFIKF